MLQKIQTIFEWAAEKIENNPAPLSRYYLLFFAILAVRLTLEFFSSQRLFSFFDVLHIGLWFIFIVLAFLLQLQLFSQEKVSKIAKLVITCFTIALSAPLIDLLVSRGVGAKMNYLALNSWHDVVNSYLTIGGASFSRGATLGIRIEIVLLLIACFNYVRTKRNSIFVGLFASLSVYTVLFLSGAIPFFLGILIRYFHLQYAPDDQSTLLLLLTLDLGLLFCLMFRHSPPKIKQIFATISWTNFGISALQFIIGTLLARHLYPTNWTLNPSTLFHFPLFVALALCFAAYLSAKKLPYFQNNTLIFNSLLFFIALISTILSTKVLFLSALLWGCLFLWKEDPLKLAQVPILRNLLAAGVGTASALLGFVAVGAPMIGFPSVWLGILLLAGFAFSLCSEAKNTKILVFTELSIWNPLPQKLFYLFSSSLLFLLATFIFSFLTISALLLSLICVILFLLLTYIWLKREGKNSMRGIIFLFYLILTFVAWEML